MKTTPIVAVVSVLLLAGSKESALKNLEAARANLTQAVSRIQKDPPSTPDLDAAHVAVEDLKKAIDEGASFEADDLDYARAALAARKELRTQRDYVEDRRAKVHIHDQRRVIDAALAALNDRVHALDKAPAQKDFDDAHAAGAALKKALDDGRPFLKQDDKFAAYVEQTDATRARQERAIDDRWIAVSADKQRGVLGDARRNLTAAMAGLQKGGSDAQFEAASQASAALSKRLEEGKPLETKDKAYRADADRARAEIAQAKKRMEEVMSETALARLTGEIDPAYQDLVSVGKAVRGRNPTPEQLAEARTASIVVHKLVDKYAPQAAVSPKFAQYVENVKKTLVEVEVELQKRELQAARKDLNQALRGLSVRDPSDDRFAEATAAQNVLEKTLQTVHDKEPALTAEVGDARTLVHDAKTTIPKRRLEVDIQRQKVKVEDARRKANAAVSEMYKSGGTEKVQEAELAIAGISTALQEGKPLAQKDREYASYDIEVKKRVNELNERIASRRAVLSFSAGRQKLTEAVSAAKAKIDAAKEPAAKDADVEAAGQSVEAVSKTLESQATMEKQDKGYAAHADRARGDLDRLTVQLDLARRARSLRKETAEVLAQGNAAAAAAAGGKDMRTQKAGYDKAVEQYKSCAASGNGMLREDPSLAKISVLMDGNATPPRDVISLCESKAKETEATASQLAGLIKFEDGPKKSYEAARALLSKGKKGDALAQFYECVSSGLILEHQAPELKERQFPVAGTQMTLAAVVKDCVHQRDSLKGK